MHNKKRVDILRNHICWTIIFDPSLEETVWEAYLIQNEKLLDEGSA
jgi:hypothetical protein